MIPPAILVDNGQTPAVAPLQQDCLSVADGVYRTRR